MDPMNGKGTRMKTTRRQFLTRTATAASLAALAAGIRTRAYAAGGDTIRLGLIGCGGRGTGAAAQALNACKRAKLVAMGDAFQDQLDRSVKAVAKQHPDRVDVPPSRRFAGMDAYEGVIGAGVDMVLLCTPPGFRPLHYEAAVKANKMVFMEKPVATDVPGIRRMIAANEQAKQKNLMVAVGLNNRHQDGVRKIIQRVHDGDSRADGHVLGTGRQVGRRDEIGNRPRPETLCVGCRGADHTGSRSPVCLCDARQDETILKEVES